MLKKKGSIVFSFGKVALTDFSLRHFNKTGAGTKILDFDPKEFEKIINEEIENFDDALSDGTDIVSIKDGYADFCKLIFIKNFTDAKLSVLPITIENSIYLRSNYEARTPDELPVLTRRFQLPPGIKIPTAKYLCIILYSKDQLKKEHKEQVKKNKNLKFDLKNKSVQWGIVSILSSDEPEETPIPPITMMRNALGAHEGGSGVVLDKDAYLKSVEYWDTHALISC